MKSAATKSAATKSATKKPAKSAAKKRAKALHPYKIGEMYIFRTVTMYITGRLTAVFEHELILEGACWIPDTARWSDFLKNPQSAREIEPFPEVASVGIGRGAIVDFCTLKSLPSGVK